MNPSLGTVRQCELFVPFLDAADIDPAKFFWKLSMPHQQSMSREDLQILSVFIADCDGALAVVLACKLAVSGWYMLSASSSSTDCDMPAMAPAAP